MEIRYPAYYKDFSCLAGACPDSCCHEWEVDVDPDAADYYRHLPGELGDRLREVLRDGEDGWASMALTEDRRCPMWREDGLCRIQAELGHDDLCDTCRNFPRLRHDYGDFIEMGLELSCPEAARLILNEDHPGWITEEVPDGEAPSYDTQTMEVLLASREKAVEIVLDESRSVGECLAGMLLFAYQVQNATDWREVREFDMDGRLEALKGFLWKGSMEDILGLYWDLEILTDRWKRRLEQGAADVPWTPQYRRLARYFIDRYWLQAVSDGEVSIRVKFIAVSCLVIRALGGELTETAQLYSKEIENDADNVDALLDAMDTDPALADLRLLDLLLS